MEVRLYKQGLCGRKPLLGEGLGVGRWYFNCRHIGIHNIVAMQKIIFLLCTIMIVACTNRTATSGNTAADSTTTTAANPPLNEEEMRFLTGCVENAKTRYTEAQSFVLCKCMLTQVQQKYPSADSATLLQHLSDTAEVAQMIRNCR